MTTLSDIHFTRGERIILNGVDLVLEPGKRTVIFGDNGAGKSTLAHILAGLLEPDKGEVFGEKAGLYIQNPEDSLLTTEVAHELAFPLEFKAVPRDEMLKLIDSSAREFGLSEHLKRSPEELSGGMISRVALATSMITDPATIVLDEPFSFLDISGRDILRRHLDRMADDGKSVCVITQNPELFEWADRAFLLRKGRLQPLTSPPEEQPFPDIFHKSSEETALTAETLTFGYDKTPVIEDFDLTLQKGEIIGITGANGTGKSTLLKLLAGLLKPDKGKISHVGRRGIVFQFPEYQLFDETVLSDVAFGPRNLKLDNPEGCARDALAKMGIPDSFHERSPHTLSEGEKRRVGLAGILAMQPDILLLDEPFSALDSKGRHLLAQYIATLAEKGGSAILVSHDPERLERLCGRVLGVG